jgi:hypothetical protein
MSSRNEWADSVFPAIVKFTGTLNDVDGKPLTGTVGVTFLLYKEQSDGAPSGAIERDRLFLKLCLQSGLCSSFLHQRRQRQSRGLDCDPERNDGEDRRDRGTFAPKTMKTTRTTVHIQLVV